MSVPLPLTRGDHRCSVGPGLVWSPVEQERVQLLVVLVIVVPAIDFRSDSTVPWSSQVVDR